jgi:hypothetical protein
MKGKPKCSPFVTKFINEGDKKIEKSIKMA